MTVLGEQGPSLLSGQLCVPCLEAEVGVLDVLDLRWGSEVGTDEFAPLLEFGGFAETYDVVFECRPPNGESVFVGGFDGSVQPEA